MNDEDYRKFCLHCNWNDCDHGCICPDNEELWQCDMYKHYHPDKVKEFEQSFEEK